MQLAIEVLRCTTQNRERLILGQQPTSHEQAHRHPDLTVGRQGLLELIAPVALLGTRMAIAACVARTVPTAEPCSSNACTSREYRFKAPRTSSSRNSRNDSMLGTPVCSAARRLNRGHRSSTA